MSTTDSRLASLSIPPNPYANDSARDRPSTFVSAKDHAFLRNLFPQVNGLDDKILSNLFHHFIIELREISAQHLLLHGTPLEHAWCADHPTLSILRALLQRPTFRRPAGYPRSQHDGGGAGQLCEADGSDAEQCADEESVDHGRKQGGERGEETPSNPCEEVQRGNGSVVGKAGSVSNPTDPTPMQRGKMSPSLVARLKLEGIID